MDTEEKIRQENGRTWSKTLAGIAILVLILGILLSYLIKIPAIVPFVVVIDGIIVFFGVLIITNELSGTSKPNTGEMRKAITVSILVVYFGLFPILAFKGIANFDIVGLSSNSTSMIPLSTNSQDTFIQAFTTLVGVIVVSYFGSRTIENWNCERCKKEEAAAQKPADNTGNPPDDTRQ